MHEGMPAAVPVFYAGIDQLLIYCYCYYILVVPAIMNFFQQTIHLHDMVFCVRMQVSLLYSLLTLLGGLILRQRLAQHEFISVYIGGGGGEGPP